MADSEDYPEPGRLRQLLRPAMLGGFALVLLAAGVWLLMPVERHAPPRPVFTPETVATLRVVEGNDERPDASRFFRNGDSFTMVLQAQESQHDQPLARTDMRVRFERRDTEDPLIEVAMTIEEVRVTSGDVVESPALVDRQFVYRIGSPFTFTLSAADEEPANSFTMMMALSMFLFEPSTLLPRRSMWPSSTWRRHVAVDCDDMPSVHFGADSEIAFVAFVRQDDTMMARVHEFMRGSLGGLMFVAIEPDGALRGLYVAEMRFDAATDYFFDPKTMRLLGGVQHMTSVVHSVETDDLENFTYDPARDRESLRAGRETSVVTTFVVE